MVEQEGQDESFRVGESEVVWGTVAMAIANAWAMERLKCVYVSYICLCAAPTFKYMCMCDTGTKSLCLHF